MIKIAVNCKKVTRNELQKKKKTVNFARLIR